MASAKPVSSRGRVEVEAVGVEDIDIAYAHAPKTLVRLASTYLREPPPCPYGPAHISHPALVEISNSSR